MKNVVTFEMNRFSGTIDTIKELEPGATVIEDGFTVSERDVADAQQGIVLPDEIRYNYPIVENGMKRSAAYPAGYAALFRREYGNIWGKLTVRICWS